VKYFRVSALKPGMSVGKSVKDLKGKVLLKEGDRLTAEHISYLSFIGIQGVDILDESDRNDGKEELTEAVEPEIREKAAKVVSDFFTKNDEMELSEIEKEIQHIVSAVVDQVLKNKDVTVNLTKIREYDNYTYSHSVDVGILAGIIGAKCGMSLMTLNDLVTAGFIHDIGKVFISRDIINAPRRLNDEERIKMMEHPRNGYLFINRSYNFNEQIVRSVYEHHEWYNGLGYPNHKGGKDLLINSRILKAADVYDAMTTKRPYHPPYLPSEVMEYIMGRSGMEFDPQVVEVMSRKLNVYPLGCQVELSDGERAVVIENNQGMVLRPKVKTLRDEKIVDLLHDRSSWNKTIVKMMI